MWVRVRAHEIEQPRTRSRDRSYAAETTRRSTRGEARETTRRQHTSTTFHGNTRDASTTARTHAGFHLAKTLIDKGLDSVKIVQDADAKKDKLPFCKYDELPAAVSVEWVDMGDAAAVEAACSSAGAVTHVYDNFAKSPADAAPVIAAAKGSSDFKTYPRAARIFRARGRGGAAGATRIFGGDDVAEAETRIFRGNTSRRRRGRDADSSWRRVAAAPPRRG